MSCAKRERVEALQYQKQRRRRIERHCAPAQNCPRSSGKKEREGIQWQARGDREQHDLGEHPERPKGADGHAAQSRSLPLQR
jgi:hypothetical protein